MNVRRRRPAVLAGAAIASWLILTVGTIDGGLALRPGERATRDYYAQNRATVLDTGRLAAARETAAADVPPITQRDLEVETDIQTALSQLFSRIRAGVPAEPPGDVPAVDTAGTTPGVIAPGDTLVATLRGRLYLDVEGDGVFTASAGRFADTGLGGIGVVARGVDGRVFRTETQTDGTFSLVVAAGSWDVSIDPADPDLAADLWISTGNGVQSVVCDPGADCQLGTWGYAPLVRPLETQAEDLSAAYAILDADTVLTLVRLGTDDVIRRALGRPEGLAAAYEASITEVIQAFGSELDSDERVLTAQNQILSNPPVVFVDGELDEATRIAVADVSARFLRPNTRVDTDATNARRSEAMNSIDESRFEVLFQPDQLIVGDGEPFDELGIAAIAATGAADAGPVRTVAVLGVLATLLASLGLYLQRFRSDVWTEPRLLALVASLVVLASALVRVTVEVRGLASWYVLPAVGLGYLAAVLFDNRMGVLIALAAGVVAAAGTRDAGVITFALLSALVPVAYVSKLSSRKAFRNSVITTSVSAAGIAAVVSWLFHAPPADSPWGLIGASAAWAFGSAALASLVAMAVMPFFESIFDITTTLRLLELTDRNHEALQLLQEKAFGTFNHSLMVGTLGDAAARGIGADNLLVRAAAYFHDIGKTEAPLYFIENQFGVPNPHDELSPDESVEIIRRHVFDGMRLAEEHGIPSEVAEGIVSHHGDGIMRFFYEKARQLEGGDVDPDRFRHAGHKPRTREMAILMLADAVEGACRAMFGEEEPTPEAIAKVVNRVVDEKVADGQLGECDLTLGELTRVRKSFIDALTGHYHQRIPYPNFPGA